MSNEKFERLANEIIDANTCMVTMNGIQEQLSGVIDEIGEEGLEAIFAVAPDLRDPMERFMGATAPCVKKNAVLIAHLAHALAEEMGDDPADRLLIEAQAREAERLSSGMV